MARRPTFFWPGADSSYCFYVADAVKMNGTVVAASPSAHGGSLTAAGPLGDVGDEQGEREMSVCGGEGLRNSLLEGKPPSSIYVE